jgi:hypothetical protein
MPPRAPVFRSNPLVEATEEQEKRVAEIAANNITCFMMSP